MGYKIIITIEMQKNRLVSDYLCFDTELTYNAMFCIIKQPTCLDCTQSVEVAVPVVQPTCLDCTQSQDVSVLVV